MFKAERETPKPFASPLHITRKPTQSAHRAGADEVLGLQRRAGNRAVTLMLQRKPVGSGPAVVYGDWTTEIGQRGMGASLHHFLYGNTRLSDRGLTLEDEFEAAIDIDTAYLVDTQDSSNLLMWQKQLRTALQTVKAHMRDANWNEAVRELITAYGHAVRIYSLPMANPQFDVKWKKAVRPGGEIVTRHTGTRVEALFEASPAGAARVEQKNLNVSLRRHWWNGLDPGSVPNPAGNSLMGPRVSQTTIQEDIAVVAKHYLAHVSKRGYVGEFGVDTPSGIHYHVNRLENQQPHCFPNRGQDTISLTSAEYAAAVLLKLYSGAVMRNKVPPVSVGQVRAAVKTAGGIVDKLEKIGVGFSRGVVKEVG